MAFAYDADGSSERRINTDHVIYQRIASGHWESVLRQLVFEHAEETQSAFANRMLTEWDREIGRFWQICPREMVDRLEYPLSDEGEAARA